MWSRRFASLLAVLGMLAAGAAGAADEEGCLFCHRYQLWKESGAGRADLRVTDPRGGPHAALHCTDCHPDARTMPHPSAPGPASCIGECHGGTPAAMQSHRRASYGGLMEAHRASSAPYAPCLLCHRVSDRPGDREAAGSRCAACHPAEKRSAAAGVHGRIMKAGRAEMCPDCHKGHQAASPPGPGTKAAAVSCDGKECHASVTPGMRNLGGHGEGGEGRATRGGIVLALAGLGWLSGRLLGGTARGRE